MVWIAFLALLAVALFLLLRPLVRPPAAFADARASELAVYRDQLHELDAELERGIISAVEADAARNEIKRKMLSVAPAPAAARDPQHAARLTGSVLAVGLPLLALGLYLWVGRPDLPGAEFSATQAEARSQAGEVADIEIITARLAERLKANPGDVQGWRMLGLAYASLDRHADAAAAYRRAAALAPSDAALLARYGESLVRAAGGSSTPEADMIFERVLAIDPREPRALFFRGLAFEQQGRDKLALEVWVKIIRDGRADAKWIPALRRRAAELAIKLKLDPAKEVPGTTSTSTETSRLSQAEQTDMIREMVEGLESRLRRDPNDLEGWLMLARSRKVLGETDAARAALKRAEELFSGNAQARVRIAKVAAELQLDQ